MQEAAAVKSWMAEFEAEFQAQSQACFDSISSRIEGKVKNVQSLQTAFEANVKTLWTDIQVIQKELEPTAKVLLPQPFQPSCE